MADYEERPVCSKAFIELTSKSLPKCQDVPKERTFFLHSELRTYLSQSTIYGLLKCGCPSCIYLRKVMKVQYSDVTWDTIARTVLGEGTQERSYVLILSLLIVSNCPPFILIFLNKECHDGYMQTNLELFTANHFDLNYLPRGLDLEYSKQLARLLQQGKYRVFPPVIDETRLDFSRDIILPFVNEMKIGEGAYGHVYAFDIPQEYLKLGHGSQTSRFARKESKDGLDWYNFEREASNLYRVREIQDSHLLHIHKAFKHGDIGILILPLAKTSLKDLLRNAQVGNPGDQLNNIQNHPFWNRLLGVSEALAKLHNFEASEPGRDGIFYGYHFDLKPANVLIGHDGIFIISDFGQAYFRGAADTTSSNVVGMGGTENYAPPEIDIPNMRMNRKYDIWSLGCIFLEIIWYLIMGPEGISKLNNCRVTISRTRRNDRYFSQDKSGIYSLKDKIRKATNDLLNLITFQPANAFMSHIIALIYHMLEADVAKRLTAAQVAMGLREILSRRDQGKLQEFSPDIFVISHAESEPGISSIVLSHLKTLEHKSDNEWCSGILGLDQENESLSLKVLQHGRLEKKLLGRRSELQLFPAYAFRQTSRDDLTDATMFIERTWPMALNPAHERLSHEFRSAQQKELLYLQSALLCQRMVGHWELTSVSLQLHEAKATKLLHKLSKKHQAEHAQDKACAVQIWSDHPEQRSSPQKRSLCVSSPRDFQSEIMPRRIVIFLPSSVYIFRLQDAFRIPKEQLKSTDSQFVDFVANRGDGKSKFSGSVLSPTSDRVWPGVALAKEMLDSDESNETFEAESIRLELKSDREAASFRKKYGEEKHAWSEQCNRYEKMRYEIARNMGFERI